ncbi:hypothetical protein Rhopal_007112-T1 [Rhodotorula paludigena]|uniref:BZIP domain-containing protein n=1 Tax=Rhodotorula paludigena TaxID=86838 RepID=A0AAV5GVQ6_9BASI|nr:hypothetical protein Rhopal_007112-T1 [Rhodotorula paludigena]
MQPPATAALELDPALAALAAATVSDAARGLYTPEQLAQLTRLDDAATRLHFGDHAASVAVGVTSGIPVQGVPGPHPGALVGTGPGGGGLPAQATTSNGFAPPAQPSAGQGGLQHSVPIAPDGELPGQQKSQAGPVSTKDMTPAEKAANRKERNRLAAQRSRDKRQAEFDKLRGECDEALEEVKALKLRVHELENLVRSLPGGAAHLPPPAVPSEAELQQFAR